MVEIKETWALQLNLSVFFGQLKWRWCLTRSNGTIVSVPVEQGLIMFVIQLVTELGSGWSPPLSPPPPTHPPTHPPTSPTPPTLTLSNLQPQPPTLPWAQPAIYTIQVLTLYTTLLDTSSWDNRCNNDNSYQFITGALHLYFYRVFIFFLRYIGPICIYIAFLIFL